MKTKPSTQIDMLNGPLLGKILTFALPVAASGILQQLFNSADVAVVGRFAGKGAMAAVGCNSSVISLMVNLFIGLSVGANVLVARLIGQGEKEKVSRAVHTAIALSLISGVVMLFVGLAIAEPLLKLMGTPDDVMDMAVLYLRIYFIGMPFFMLYNFGAAILRSVGDTKRPLYCLIASGVINVGLNLLFVLVFGMDVDGVATATVISNVVSACMVLDFLTHETSLIRVDLKKLKINRQDLMEMVRIGVPAGLQGAVFSLSNVCIQSAINSFNTDAVAGSSAAVNFEFFTYFMTTSFAQASVTFTSQNFGARQFERCKKIWLTCLLCAVVCSGAMSAAFTIFRSFFLSFYTDEAAVLDYAYIRILRVESLTVLTVLYEVTGATLRGMGYSMLPALVTLIGSCALRFVWVYTVFVKYPAYETLMNVYPISWIITASAMLIFYFVIRHKLFSQGAQEEKISA